MDELKPEECARIKIDEQLVDAGWHIANRGGVTYDHNAVALVEGLLDGNREVDYLLFVPTDCPRWSDEPKILAVATAKTHLNDFNLELARSKTLNAPILAQIELILEAK